MLFSTKDKVDMIQYPKDNARSWLVLVSDIFLFCVNGQITGSLGVYFVVFRDYFHAENAKVSLITSLPMSIAVLAGPVSCLIYETLGCRINIMLSGLVSCLGFLLVSYSQNITHVTLCFALIGIGMGIPLTAQVAVIPEYFDKYRDLAMALAPIGDSFGLVFSRFLVYLVDLYTWRGAMFIVAGVTLQTIVCGALMKSRKPKKRPKFENLFPLKLLKDPLVLINNITFTLTMSAFIIYISMINALMIDRDVSEVTASSLVSYSALANFVGRLVIPFFIHFFKTDVLKIAAIFSALETIAILAATFSHSIPYFAADLMLSMFSFGMHEPLDSIVNVYMFGAEKLPKIYAVTAIPMAIGLVGLPKLAGYLADAYSLDVAFYFCAGCAGLSCLIYSGMYMYLPNYEDENRSNAIELAATEQ